MKPNNVYYQFVIMRKIDEHDGTTKLVTNNIKMQV